MKKNIIIYLLFITSMLLLHFPTQDENLISEDILHIALEKTKDADTSDVIKRIEPFFISPSRDYIDSANNMLEGQYFISGHGTFDFSKGIPWGESPVPGEEFSRSYYRALHAHFFINDLIAAYKDTNDPDYIHKGYDIINDWINKNYLSKNPEHVLAWHDEGTARRLITWINYYDAARDELESEQLLNLLTNIIEHANLLMTDSFHSTNTNHGMFQDEALIVFGDYFSDIEGIKSYSDKGKERLNNYFDFIISKEGVHLEHSPGYHQIIANTVKKYKDYFNALYDENEFRKYESIYESMANYYTWVIKPDGTLPLLGDTFTNVKPPTNLWQDNPYYIYSLTGGSQGTRPEENSMVFEDAGYAIFREDWDIGINSTYIHFTAAYHTDYHKHSDDLSVWIYANGRDIVTEAGPNGYDYHLPFTEFAYSSFAHNTLVVNDTSLPRVDDKYDQTYIESYNIEGSVSRVTGINKRYKGIEHKREVVYDRDDNTIIISDKVNANNTNNYKFLWNLAEGIKPVINNNTIDLYDENNKELMSIEINSDSNVQIFEVKGQKDPYLLGWHLIDRNKPLETSTIVVEINAISTQVETVFKIK